MRDQGCCRVFMLACVLLLAAGAPTGLVAADDAEQDAAVAVKIKGGYGSTRDLDDRPALTFNMDKHVPGRRFHGLDKFHLNNSVQDESLLRELLGSTMAWSGMRDTTASRGPIWQN